jgi:hypothetical protein
MPGSGVRVPHNPLARRLSGDLNCVEAINLWKKIYVFLSRADFWLVFNSKSENS